MQRQCFSFLFSEHFYFIVEFHLCWNFLSSFPCFKLFPLKLFIYLFVFPLKPLTLSIAILNPLFDDSSIYIMSNLGSVGGFCFLTTCYYCSVFLPDKAIKLFFSISPKTLSLRFDLAPVCRGWVFDINTIRSLLLYGADTTYYCVMPTRHRGQKLVEAGRGRLLK